MAKGKSFMLGIATGGAVGAAAALFTTPESGKNLRNRAKRQGVEWKESFEKLRNDTLHLKERITQTSKEGAVLIKELTQEMKSSVETWKETVEPHQENIQEYLVQIESSLKELEDKVENQKN
ncbi:YtxH domain-containing protein [Lentibacillus lipolyticus]|nr:YtxH domain-containing protein [Lentibacillus lipolyticus]